MENSKHDGTLCSTATSVKFCLFRSEVFDIGFPYKHCISRSVCLPVKMASETVTRSILGGAFYNSTWKLL